MAIGRIAMRYRRVECAPPASIEVKVDKFSGSGGWIRLLVQVSSKAVLLKDCWPELAGYIHMYHLVLMIADLYLRSALSCQSS